MFSFRLMIPSLLVFLDDVRRPDLRLVGILTDGAKRTTLTQEIPALIEFHFDRPQPDAVFIGGSKGALDAIIEVALDRMPSGGRLVANAITLENVAEAYSCLRKRGLTPDVTMLSVSRAEPLARYMRWEAQNPIHIFAVEKP